MSQAKRSHVALPRVSSSVAPNQRAGAATDIQIAGTTAAGSSQNVVASDSRAPPSTQPTV